VVDLDAYSVSQCSATDQHTLFKVTGDETAASKEANLRKHLAGEAAAEQISAPVIKPDPKKTYDDFQLSYAKDLLRGGSGGAVSQR
jgi:hypothetical protein